MVNKLQNLPLASSPADTVVTIAPEQMIEMYKTLLETEQTNYTVYVSILLGLVVALIAFAIYWNMVQSKDAMKKEIKKLVDKQAPEIVNEVLNKLRQEMLVHDLNIYRALGATQQKPETYSYSSTWYAKALVAAVKADHGRQARSLAMEIVNELTDLKNRNILRLYQIKPFHEAIAILPGELDAEKEKLQKLVKEFTGLVSDEVNL